MTTFNEIYFNGNEYSQMWLNGSKIWEKASGGSGGGEKEPIVTTYTTFNKESTSSYCSFTTNTEANTVTIKYTYTGSSYYHSNIYTKLDTILPRKCRVRITGESQGTYKYMSYNGSQYPTNSIMCLSACETLSNAWWESHSMPSDGIVYNNGTKQTTSEALDYNEIILYQLNPSQYYLSSSSTNFYPFEYDFTYCFPSEPRLYLNYSTHVGGTKGALYSNTYVTYKDLKIEVYEYPIESIYLTIDDDINNITNAKFTINSTILPSLYSDNDLEIIYDSTYMEINANTGEVKLKDGCQGLTHTVTYRSKSDNSISKSITFTVSQDLEIGMDAIDFTQSTAPTLPDCMTLDGQGSSYYFKHGTYTTNVYGLVPNNSGKHNSTAYTRYKFVAPTNGALTFTYRCYAETNYDYLTVHVDTSTSQPSYSSSTNQVFTTKGVSSYQQTDGTASVNVTSGTTYYIHIQYYKDGSASDGYDKGCLRSIELVGSGSSSGGTTTPTVTYGNILTSSSSCSVSEGDYTTIGVKLDKAPTNNQTVSVSINSSYTTINKTSLTFTPSNYSTYQYVTVTANKDGAYTNRTETITLSSPNVSSKTITVNVTNTETQPSTTESSTIDFTLSSTLPSYATLQSGSLEYDASHCAIKFMYNGWGGSSYALIKYVAPKTGELSILYDNKYCYYDNFTIKIGTSQTLLQSIEDSYASFDSTHNQTNPYQVTQGTTYYIEFRFTSGDECEDYYNECACVQSISVN